MHTEKVYIIIYILMHIQTQTHKETDSHAEIHTHTTNPVFKFTLISSDTITMEHLQFTCLLQTKYIVETGSD